MYFKDYLEKYKDKKINIFIDMDGVVADYDVISYNNHKNEANVYLDKRPIKTSINILEEVSKMNNVTLNILSVSRNDNQIEGKKKWLKMNMSFINEERINIIPRESNGFKSSHILKKEFLEKNISKDSINIVIDDSHLVLDTICDLNIGIIPLHITSILD